MLKSRIVRVVFSSGIAPSESEYFEEINAYDKKILWLLLLFISRTMVPLTNGVQTYYYSKISKLKGTCYIPQLKQNNWTFEQIVQITRSYGPNLSQELDQCEYFGYNYTEFDKIGYSEAMELKKKLKNQKIQNCTGQNILIYENSRKFENMEIPFCHANTLAKRMVLLKRGPLLIGGIFFGILGDIFGRRKIAIVVAIMWSVCSLCLAFSPKGASEVFYVVTNCLNNSLDLLTYVNLLELCHKKIRFFAVLTFYGGTGFFILFVQFASTLNFDWNYLLYVCFCFTLVSLFHCWYVPESPRWLINESRYKDALAVMKEIIGYIPNEIFFEDDASEKTFYFEKFKNSFRYLRKRKIETIVIMAIISAIIAFIEETQVMRMMQPQFPVNGAIAAATTKFLSFLYTMIIYGSFGKKFGLFWTFMCISFASFVTLSLRDSTEIDIHSIAVLILNTCAAEKFVFAYVPDLLPTFLRCTGMGIVFSSSSLARIITVELINWEDVKESTIYLVFLLISLPAFVTFKLPDTTLSDLSTIRLFRV